MSLEKPDVLQCIFPRTYRWTTLIMTIQMWSNTYKIKYHQKTEASVCSRLHRNRQGGCPTPYTNWLPLLEQFMLELAPMKLWENSMVMDTYMERCWISWRGVESTERNTLMKPHPPILSLQGPWRHIFRVKYNTCFLTPIQKKCTTRPASGCIHCN